jgi:transposase
MLTNGVLVKANITVKMADGTLRTIKEAIEVNIRLGSTDCRIPLLILPDVTDDLILGLDFLTSIGASLSCGGETINLGTSEANKANCLALRKMNPSEDNTREAKDEKLKPQEVIHQFLQEELGKFERLKGPSNITTHKITMKDDKPIKQRYYPKNPAMQAIISKEIDELLEKDCIEPSHSAYSAPIVLVKKKNGQWRLCVDYRQLNAKSIPDAYPLPRIQHILDRLRDAQYISTLDLKNGYWQIPMSPESKQYTAFTVPGRGLFQWKVMPFGLHSAPATFQRALDQVIGPEMEPHAFAYLDDIIVVGKTLQEHMENLKEVFRRLRAANLKINKDKCEFFKEDLKYLGHVVSRQGIHTDPDKVAAISELPPPTNVKGVRRFLGVASWYRRFVPDFAELVVPLTNLLKKGKRWSWTDEQQRAFEIMKEKLTEAPVLACPDFSKPFTLQTDASNNGLGAVLTQESEEGERVIAYASRHLNKAEINYSATEKECLAIVWGIRKMRPYLEGYKFNVITDHLSLKWLNSLENPSGRIARWALELQQYVFDVKYRKGKWNVVADTLSRQPLEALNKVTTEIGKCSWTQAKMAEVKNNPEKMADYAIQNGQLYRHIPGQSNDEDCSAWKLCVPKYLRARVLKENHNDSTAGHPGIRKTTTRIANKYYWPGMFRDIRNHVRCCDSCQRYKPTQDKPAGEMLTQIPDEPWSIICADFIGPLPRTKHGNTIILIFFDKFSKWTEIVPLRQATTDGVKRAFRERILARYGVPKVLVTDNGVQFNSRPFQRFLQDLGVRQQFTAPYTPQENPTERANRNVKRILSQLISNRQTQWDEFIPEISLAINSMTSETTGFTPAFLTQGREPRLPGSLFDEVTIGTGSPPQSPEYRGNRLKEIYNIVRRNLERAAQDQARHYNLRRRRWNPEVGTLVLAKTHYLSKAVDKFNAKLAPKYDGPYRIESYTSPVIVQLTSLGNLRNRTAHIKDLKEYHQMTDEPDKPL